MKKLLFLVPLAAILCLSCELETSDNGDLDGFWQLKQVDTLQGGTKDMRGSGVFWAVQTDLLEARIGGTGVFLAEKFESPTRCIENLAPPIGPRPFEPVQSLLERTACPAKTSIYAIKAATKAGKALLLLALRWIINPFHGLGLALAGYSALSECILSGFFTLCEKHFQFKSYQEILI